MRLPEPHSVSWLLTALLGEMPRLLVAEDLPGIADLRPGYGCFCIDDDDMPVAAIVVDLRASVAFGSQLMMLPPSGLDRQVKAGAADLLVVDALSEVFNNLTTTLNRVRCNPHVRSTPSLPLHELMASDAAGMLKRPSARLDLCATFSCGDGRLVMLKK